MMQTARSHSLTQIEIDGDVDTAVPGDYTLTYHVTDSDGNQIKCGGAYRTRSVRIEELL